MTTKKSTKKHKHDHKKKHKKPQTWPQKKAQQKHKHDHKKKHKFSMTVELKIWKPQNIDVQFLGPKFVVIFVFFLCFFCGHFVLLGIGQILENTTAKEHILQNTKARTGLL